MLNDAEKKRRAVSLDTVPLDTYLASIFKDNLVTLAGMSYQKRMQFLIDHTIELERELIEAKKLLSMPQEMRF